MVIVDFVAEVERDTRRAAEAMLSALPMPQGEAGWAREVRARARARLEAVADHRIPGEQPLEGRAGLIVGEPAPDANEEVLIYQTLVGTWPISIERLWGYLEKAVREAKEHTSWTAPDARYALRESAAISRLAELVGFVGKTKQAKLLESLGLRDLKNVPNVREEEIVLTGRGVISFGRPAAASEDLVRYCCER